MPLVAEEVAHAWEEALHRQKGLFQTYFLQQSVQIGRLFVPFSVFFPS